jgi:hypothetical protein
VQILEIEYFQEGRVRKTDGLVERVGADRDEILRDDRPGDGLDIRDVRLDRRADRGLDRVEFFDAYIELR